MFAVLKHLRRIIGKSAPVIVKRAALVQQIASAFSNEVAATNSLVLDQSARPLTGLWREQERKRCASDCSGDKPNDVVAVVIILPKIGVLLKI